MVIEWAAFLLGILQGAVLLAVAVVVSRRRLEGDSLTANRLFAVWWWAVGAIVLLRAAVVVLQGFWGPLLALQVTYVQVVIILLTAGAWALSSYLAFIFTGRLNAWIPLAVAYAMLLVAMLFIVAYARPTGLEGGQWEVGLEYQNDVSGLAAVQVILVLLFLPPLLGALAYASLLFRVRARPQRMRIAMVSGALAVWLGSSVLAVVAGWDRFAIWVPIGRVIGLAAAVVVFLAYRPPKWLRRAGRE